MNMEKKLVLAAGLTVLGGATAFGDFARGYFNNWANNCPLTRPEGGNYYSGTLQAVDMGQDPGLKFDNDGNWGGNKWGAGTAAVVNETIGTAQLGNEIGNLAMDVSDGYYYTFHLAGDWDWGDRSYVVMKTQYQPATILDVVDDSEWVCEEDVTLTASCSAGTAEQISPEETFYILYTTDGDWNTAKLVEMSGSGLVREGTIPGQPAETTVQYKVFGTTMPTNCLTTETIYSSPNNIQKIDFCMLSLKEGSYTVPDYIDYMGGNAWHCPTNTEPYASMTMRTPGTLEEVALGDHPLVRLGVNPTSGSDAPTKVQLKYKAGDNAWETLTMELEPPGDGWQAKYDGNDYYTNSIPIDKLTVGMKVQYYFYVEYANSSLFGVTSVGTTDQRGSIAYLGPNEAKAHPFEFTVVEAPEEATWSSLQNKLDLGGVVKLTCDLSAADGDNEPLTVATDVTLDLAGHTLDAAGLFGVIVIYSGGHLTLTNSVPGSGAITGGGNCNNGAGVYVYGGGRFTMAGGTISGNTANVHGGGVYVDYAMDDGGEGAAFEMTGGLITGNFAWYGGGVHIEGETECTFGEEGDDDYYSTLLAAGRFTMTGGMITGNGVSDDGDGGGVHVMDVNTLFLSGAPVISGNTNSVGSANNVYLGVSGRIDVGPLSEGASIGVTTYLEPEVGSPVAVSYSLASTDDTVYFFSDNPAFSLGLISDELFLIDPSAASYWDPLGDYIVDPSVIEWLSTNGITQADIDALGNDRAAMEKMYECYMLNCDFRVQDAGATINFTDITVSNDVVSVTVQLTRKAPLGAIKGYLYFYGARDLADGFDSSPIQDASVDFGSDDPTFATAPTTGSVTQTATSTFSYISYKFFKAAIHAYLPGNGDEPWEPEEPGEEEP